MSTRDFLHTIEEAKRCEYHGRFDEAHILLRDLLAPISHRGSTF